MKDTDWSMDVLLPTQVSRYRVLGSSERGLHFGMLELSLHDVFLPVRMSKARPGVDINERNRKSAERWFENRRAGNGETYISYGDACHATGLRMSLVDEATEKCAEEIVKPNAIRAACVRALIVYLRRRVP